MTEHIDWNDSYRDGNLPWDTGRPSSELQRVFSRNTIQPCRALELGCGTGTNSVWLAQQGFEVTGIDLAPLAVERAEKRAHAAGVKVHFVVADVLHLPDLAGPFAFFFDRGCYHAVRRNAPQQYAAAVAQQLVAGGRGSILAGNAREPHDPGPPVVTEEQIRDELGLAFQILDLHEFRFDEAPGVPVRFLGWSCVVEKALTVGLPRRACPECAIDLLYPALGRHTDVSWPKGNVWHVTDSPRKSSRMGNVIKRPNCGTTAESREVIPILGMMRGCALLRIWPCCEPHQIKDCQIRGFGGELRQMDRVGG